MYAVLLAQLRCRAPLVVLATLFGILAGCGPGGPKTHPVNGKVVLPKAEYLKSLAGWDVEFQSTVEPHTRAYGKIKPDGSFSLSTYRQGVSLPGAIEGPHKARLLVEAGDDDDDDEMPQKKRRWPFKAKYTRFETSGWEITVPTEGEVVLKAD